MGQLACSEALRGTSVLFLQAPPALCPPGEARTWEFSYLRRAGCGLCCVPTKVSKLRDELADFCGRLLRCPGPAWGGGVFCWPGPLPCGAGLPVSLAFSAAPGPRSSAGLSQRTAV